MRGPWLGAPLVRATNSAGIDLAGGHELSSVDLYPLQGGPSW